ncbi:MAG: hypothetical protein RMZ41_003925 [Nostoc sp. DedVER02]|uniref:hypothetical protein n=1 Tax=unclassified Nostoc TaxID=2593658 RepID=UPI002AD50CCC|nr:MULTISPECIES: hypothetical protein [unclassified Nostoc]MDZ7984456.1 hypothetical protein [Nostoc sp. DedVER02]MDZ8115597.1 hypothetical protein [Nostoc sp. DedVER01b]
MPRSRVLGAPRSWFSWSTGSSLGLGGCSLGLLEKEVICLLERRLVAGGLLAGPGLRVFGSSTGTFFVPELRVRGSSLTSWVLEWVDSE